jgi:microsomal dipeptidase-like Zn-dependent dipeptidase
MGNVWGFADYHAHPMAHISFGGLKGIRTIWGAPGHAWTAYASDPNAIRRDFPQCNASHFGGRVAPLFINGVESQLPGFEIFMGFTRDHNPFGGDATALREFQAFPSFEAGAHLQYHITQIRRAYEGGLRLMSALVVNNEMAEFVMSRTVDKGNDKAINLTPERVVVLNNDWMDIAYTPHDARRIIRSGKLAVILGTELDHTGSLYPGKAAADEVAELFRMGIRQITPIHAIDTNLGGAALFQDMYNTGNYQANKKWFNAKDNTACGKGTSRGECVLFHLDDSETEAIIGDSMAITLGDGDHERHPWRATHDTPQYKNKAGVTNTDGLKGDGFAYLQAAMQRGMLIDISHMSDVGAGQAVGVAQKPDMNVTLHPYPLMISHAGFREQMFRKDYTPWRDDLKGVCTVDGTLGIGTEADCASKVKDWLTQKGHTSNGQILPGTINDGFLPSEFDVPVSLAQAVAALGGVVGPFVAQEPIDDAATLAGTNFPLPFTNDCAMTSKGFAAAYQYARKMGFSSVGIASDFGMHMTMAPRFGGMACGAWRKAGPWDRQAFWVIERTLNPSQYKMGNQQYGVVYSDAPTRAGVTPGTNAPLKPYKMATRTFDINVDGLANYGLMPDLIQDMANVSQGALDLNPFFASAEGYIQMWEKAWYAVGCKPGRGLCEAPPTPVEGCTARDDSVCKGLGPDSFNHGAPLVELAERTDRCSQGIVQFEGTAVVGTNALKEGDWAILQVANPKFAWHCGTQDNTDWTECPSGTRYVRVERSSSQDAVKGQAIHTACLAAPLGSGPPPTQTVVYLDTRKEKCGRKTLRVHTGDTVDNSPGRLTDTNQVAVRKVNVKTFRTFCEENPGDASPIDTDLPAGTNLVKVRRLDIKGDHPHVDARRFVLECYHQN